MENIMSDKIQFTGRYEGLNNSYISPILVEGITFPSVTYAFKAAQTSDRTAKIAISKAPTLTSAEKIVKTTFVRPNWDEVKHATLHQLVKLKFESHKDLADILLSTENKPLGKVLTKVRSELLRERSKIS
tara:strand:+ start:4333 stop:4722 length:390 start_codon:yes stop_codon:yes gene_type:complete